MFGEIQQIVPSASLTWAERLFITIDIDWASDEVLSWTIDLIESVNIPATWFVTHPTPLLRRLRENPNFELGIHPNFNNLLLFQDTSNGRTAEEIIERLMNFVPNAVSVRSHSLTQSSVLTDLFSKFGLTHECNILIPNAFEFGTNVVPYLHWNNMIKVPHIWEDDVALYYDFSGENLKRTIAIKGLKVFDFHPIHLFLNTEKDVRYNSARKFLKDFEKLKSLINQDYGTRNEFLTIVENFTKKQNIV